jgi:hypothetical protein
MEPNCSLMCSQGPATGRYLGLTNPVPILTPYCSKICFNIILPSTPRYSKWSLLFRFPDKNLYTFLISPMSATWLGNIVFSFDMFYCTITWKYFKYHWLIMRSYHDVHEMNTYRADLVCPSVRQSAWFNSRTARRILMKFGMHVMSLESILKSYF